jgi:MFS family permease
LFAAQVIALVGTGLSTVALALLAYDLAGGDAGVVLGTALALKMIAYVGIAPIVGAFAHQLPRRALLIGLDIARAITVMCIPFVTEIWQIYVLIFLLNACSAGFTPTFQATIPDVLPDDERYTRALSLSRIAYDLENLLSPLLAAAALVVLSYDALFSVNALTFLISACLIFSLQLPSPQPLERDVSVWNNLTFGLRVYMGTPRLRGLLALSFSVAAAGAMVIVNTVVYVREHLGGSESETALAFAAFGAGSMVIALALPRVLDRIPDRPFMLMGSLVLSSGLLLALLQPDLLALLLIWAGLGAGTSLIQTPAGRLLKRSASEGDRPAIYAAQFALSHGCWLIAYPLAGWVGGTFSLAVAFLILGFLAMVSTVAAMLLWPADDPVVLGHKHEPAIHDHHHVHDEHHQHTHEGWEGEEPHRHLHSHTAMQHRHAYVIDIHHPEWPTD